MCSVVAIIICIVRFFLFIILLLCINILQLKLDLKYFRIERERVKKIKEGDRSKRELRLVKAI